MYLLRISATATLVAAALSASTPAMGVPLVARPQDESRFRITAFATGLSFPTSMASLSDGSLLVATNTGGAQSWIGDHYIFTSPSATLVRLVDNDHDGVADGPGVPLATGLPGLVSSVRRVGTLIMAISARDGAQAITLWRTGAAHSDQLSLAGVLSLTVPQNYLHSPCALAARPTAGGGVELFVSVGSQFNAVSGTATVGMTWSGGAVFSGTAPSLSLASESIHRIMLTDTGTSVTLTEPLQVARGLRNSAGMTFAANGDLLLNDNGSDDPNNSSVSLSADELNLVPNDILGSSVLDFGFAGTYVDYATGATVGPSAGVVAPVAAFRPLDGEKSEGAVELAIAPPSFPSDFAEGVFVPFSGVFNAGGASNDENPLVFVDPQTGIFFHFLANGQMGHPNGVLATNDALYLSDLSVTGAFGGFRDGVAADQSGAIYRIVAVPEPSAIGGLLTAALLLSAGRFRRRCTAS